MGGGGNGGRWNPGGGRQLAGGIPWNLDWKIKYTIENSIVMVLWFVKIKEINEITVAGQVDRFATAASCVAAAVMAAAVMAAD